MKKPISVSNLTLDLYLDYVRPAAIAAGIIELTATEDGKRIYVTDTATADEITHCMWCACMCAGNDGIERTHEEYIRHEAERMIGDLEVSIKFDLHNTVATLTALRDAMTAALTPAEAPQEAQAADPAQQPTETAEAAQAAPAARQANPITEAIIDSMAAQAPAHTVTVTWANGTRATYSANMLDMLKTDPAALDIQDDETGEMVYIKPDDAPAAQAEADPTETTTNEQKEEGNTMSTTANDLQKYVDGIAADLRRLYEADPTDEEREAAEENGDAYDLYSYFNDMLDIEYTISSRGDYLGARIAVALGGPNIYIDTREGYVKGYWGTDRAARWIPSEICEEINDIMEEYYDMVRGA